MVQFTLSNFNRFILDTEDDANSPVNEEYTQQLRYNKVALLLLMLDTGESGTATSDPPNDTTGWLIDTAAGFVDDEHNGRSLLITSGTAKGLFYTIDDTEAGNNRVECAGDNLYAAGVRSGDSYKILYALSPTLPGHDHDGINTPQVALGDSQVTQAKLKTTTGVVSVNLGAGAYGYTAALPGGEYGFRVQTKANAAGEIDFEGYRDLALTTSYASPCCYFHNNDAGYAHVAYAQERYVQSSGEVFWIFIQRDKTTKEIIRTWSAPDHYCFGHGGDPDKTPHPYNGIYDPATDEIVVINPSHDDVKQMQREASDTGKCFAQIMLEDYEINERSRPAWPDKEITVGLPEDWENAWLSRRPVSTIKKQIPKPDDVIHRRLKKRSVLK